MSRVVSISRCADYERGRVRAAVREALGRLPELESLIPPPGEKVLLKPNLLSSNDTPDHPVNTHPVRAAAEFFIERGCRVFIGDSCGSLAPGSTGKAIRMTGLDRVAAETGATLLDFDREPSLIRPIPQGVILKEVTLPQIIEGMDLFVTLPKFRTHGLTTLTGAVKNQLGLVPGKGKKEAHLAAPKPLMMAQALLDIHSLVRPDLALMDGIVAMEGNGPAAGSPRTMGLVLASADAVALDAVMAAIMGLKPEQVDTVRLGHERGLGTGRLEEIAVAGVPLAQAAQKDYKMPPAKVRSAIMAAIPAPVMRWAFDIVGARSAAIIAARCILCGECVTNCPAKAIVRAGDKLHVETAKCICCYCCSEVCQQRAIRMDRPLAGRAVHALFRLITGGRRKR